MSFNNTNKEYGKESTINEDKPVVDFLKTLSKDKNLKYLELGAGLGRFPSLLKESKNINTTCLEINNKLVDELRKQNLKTIQGEITKLPFSNNEFDVIHCSHVIEHLGYPEITIALDEMFRVVKTNGYVIIRSPLMHNEFYNDIDHIRPYPPKCILQYFNNKQQQKKGKYNIQLVKNWNRREALQINSSFKGCYYINQLLKKLWSKYRWPHGKANGYIAFLKKINKHL